MAGRLGKSYELIRFHSFIKEAREARFPSVLRKLAVGMYAGRRRIVKDKVYSRAVRPRKGIVAGCSIATTLVKVCLRRVMNNIRALYPRITRRIFLDDISLQWKGRGRGRGKGEVSKNKVTKPPQEFIDAVVYCIKMLGDALGARVSAKSRFLANSRGLLHSCLEAFKKLGLEDKGSGAAVTRYLGIDYSAITQVSRNRPTRKARLVKAKRKMRRARMLTKAGADVTKVWLAGSANSVAFGAQIYGANGAALEQARKICGVVVLPGGGPQLDEGVPSGETDM